MEAITEVINSAVASKGSYSSGVWVIGDLAPGETVVLTLDAKVLGGGTVTGTVAVIEPEENLSNNIDTDTIELEPCDIGISVDYGGDVVLIGTVVMTTITVTNYSAPVTGAVVNLTMNNPVLSYSVSTGSYSPGVWVVGDLGVGEKVTLVLEVEVLNSDTITGVVTINEAEVNG